MRLVLATMVALALSGCGAEVADGGDTAPFAAWEGFDPEKSMQQAALTGTLALEDGCVYVLNREGGRRLPVFPVETVWDEDAQQLSLDGHAVTIGDKVVLGGGQIRRPQIDRLPDGCDLDSLVDPDSYFRTTPIDHPKPAWPEG